MPDTSTDLEAQDAELGERMIEVSVRFFTNNIVEGKGKIRPKHAWSCGMIRVKPNSPHKIRPRKSLPFHSLMDLNAVMEKVLQLNGVRLHPSRTMAKLMGEHLPKPKK